MRSLRTARVIALLLVYLPFNLDCSSPPPPSLRLKSTSDLSTITFHLLDVDPFYLVKDAENDHPRMKVLAGKLNARRFGGYSLSSDVFLFLDQSKPLWETHVIKSGETDTAGNGQFDEVKPGRHWIMAYTKSRTAFWLQQIDLKHGINEVFLERGNALYFQ